MKAARFEKWCCASCGYEMDAASDITGDALPKEGDLSVCMRCAAPYVLAAQRWRLLTDEELIDLPFEDKRQLSRVQILVREFNKQREKP